jgi:nucleoside 2-deoxyribosyltransferase
VSSILQKLADGIPTDAFPCWVIDEEQKNQSLKNNQPFRHYRPSCYFKPTLRLDNNFIQGNIGHTSFGGKYHDNISTTYTYFGDFQNRKPVYFSFDLVTIYRLIEILPTSPLTLTLKRLDNPKAIVKDRAFMIMPIDKDKKLEALYKDNIRTFLKDDQELGIQIFRADDFNGNDIIIETIYNQIEQAEFIIADISLPNKNVFYELGWASAMEKEIITIQSQDIEQNVFFDRSHIRTRLYSFGNIPELQRQLKNDIIAIRQKTTAKN